MSLLSEYAVLGFEYGYAMANPNGLVIWEAQFGDFANSAQIIIDQFLSSAQSKWQRMNGVVMLLPGATKARAPSTPAPAWNAHCGFVPRTTWSLPILPRPQTFHALRRQLAWPFRKPLVNFSPKANLRLTSTYSHISQFTQGGFAEVIDDTFVKDAGEVKKVMFSAAVSLLRPGRQAAEENRKDAAIIRLEQLYPLPAKQLEAPCQKYSNATLVLGTGRAPEHGRCLLPAVT